MITLLNRIEAHMRAKRMTSTRFGREAVRDPRLVTDLRKGRRVGRRITARVNAYIAAAAEEGR